MVSCVTKLRFVLIFSLVLLNCVFAIAQQKKLTGDNWKEVLEKKSGKITVAYLGREPFGYKDKDGKLIGFEVEIIKKFLNYLKVRKGITLNVEWIEKIKFLELYNLVKNGSGGVFGVGTVSITEKRKSEIKFSPSYLTSMVALVTHSSTPNLQSIDQIGSTFRGMSALTLKGTTLENYMLELKKQYYPGMKIQHIPSVRETIDRILAENDKYFTYIELVALWPAMKQGKPVKRHPVGDRIAEDLGIIMPLNSDWDGVVKEFFESGGGGGFRSTMSYFVLLKKYFGQEVGEMLKDIRSSGKKK